MPNTFCRGIIGGYSVRVAKEMENVCFGVKPFPVKNQINSTGWT